jgi:hypothetical protein
MEFLLLITIVVVIILAVIFIDAFIDARFPNFNFALKLLDLIKNIFQLFIVLSLIFIAIGIIGIVLFDLYKLIVFFIDGGSPPYNNWAWIGIQLIITLILAYSIFAFIYWFLYKALNVSNSLILDLSILLISLLGSASMVGWLIPQY